MGDVEASGRGGIKQQPQKQPHLGQPDGRKQSQVLEKSGERGRNRTFNLLIKSQLLCQLSYAPLMLWKRKKTLPGETTSV